MPELSLLSVVDPAPVRVSSAEVYDAALAGAPVQLVRADGSRQPLGCDRWLGAARGSDLALLDRLPGPALDLGCGPGRFVNALAQRGVPALGVDRSERAVALTRSGGGLALQRCLFSPLPAEGRWASVLLADGNIGIGGDPTRLLGRCRQLVARDGDVVVELSGRGFSSSAVRLEAAGVVGDWFPWATVGPEAIAALARAAGLAVVEQWVASQDGRAFALLRRPGRG